MQNIIGLPNFGNSCYFNSIMQLLKPIHDYISNKTNNIEDLLPYYESYYNQDKLLEMYVKIMKKLNSNGEQQDAGEALLDIIDKLNDKYKFFNTIYNNVIRCNNCKVFRLSERNDNNTILSTTELNFLKEDITFKRLLSCLLKSEINNEQSLINLFREDNKCKCLTNNLTIQMVLVDLPEILLINIGRYNNLTNIKNTSNLTISRYLQITTPKNLNDKLLNLDNTDINNEYELYGIILHLGNSMNSGHYIAYTKNYYTNKWYSCNDYSINELEELDINSDILKKNSYILLYMKV